MATITKIEEFVKVLMNRTTERLRDNLFNMRDSRGHNRAGSGAGLVAEVVKDGAFKIQADENKLTMELYMPSYYDYVNKGVRGWDMAQSRSKASPYSFKKGNPPIPRAAMRQFMLNRGIVPRNKAGKRTTPKNYVQALDQLAWVIGASIKRKGLEPFPFYDNVINEQWAEDVRTGLIEVFGEVLVDDIQVTWSQA